MGWGWHGWWMGWMWAFWIIVVIALVWGVVRVTSGSRGVDAQRTPEELLRQRYARGEIDTEEFQRRIEMLRHGNKVA